MLVAHARDLGHQIFHGRLGDLGAHVHRRDPVTLPAGRIDRTARAVGVALLFAQVREEPARGAAAKHLVHHLKRVVLGIHT